MPLDAALGDAPLEDVTVPLPGGLAIAGVLHHTVVPIAMVARWTVALPTEGLA